MGRLLTRYSPVRRSPPPKSAEASFGGFPLDLHVLGTPPAFVLSQDQTLKKVCISNPPLGELKISQPVYTDLKYSVYPEFTQMNYLEPALFNFQGSMRFLAVTRSVSDLFIIRPFDTNCNSKNIQIH